MSTYKIEALPLQAAVAGEGPHWDVKRQELFYVNGIAKIVHRYNPLTRKEQKLLIDEDGEPRLVSFIIPIQSEVNRYVIGCGGSICVLDWPDADNAEKVQSGPTQKISPKQLKTLYSVASHVPPITFNDAKCDARGRLWTGTMCIKADKNGFEIVPGVGNLYRLDTDGNVTTQVTDIGLSNGMGWSPDNTAFYYIDSLTYGIDAFDYDLETGNISNRRTIFNLKAHKIEGLPDGMCVDANGNLWVAVFDSGKVLNINPSTGQLITTIEFPIKKITSCTFGGPNLDELYVTSAVFGLSEAEIAGSGAGALYRVTGLGVKGATAGVDYGGKV